LANLLALDLAERMAAATFLPAGASSVTVVSPNLSDGNSGSPQEDRGTLTTSPLVRKFSGWSCAARSLDYTNDGATHGH